MSDFKLRPNPFFVVEKNKKKYAVSLDNMLELSFTEVGEEYPKRELYGPRPNCIKIKPNARFEEISLFDATRNVKASSEKVRIEELLRYFQLEPDVFASFSLKSKLIKTDKIRPDLTEMPVVKWDEFIAFQRQLDLWFSAGFPRACRIYCLEKQFDRYGQFDGYSPIDQGTSQVHLPSPVFYEPIGAMAYDFTEYCYHPQMRFQRLFLNPDGCGLRQALIPTICVQVNIRSNQWEMVSVMTCLPGQKKLPMYNLNRVTAEKTDTVVICDCVEDADALQRANEDCEQVAFTAFVPEHMEQTDWSMIEGKNVVILISNHSGRTVEDVFERANTIYEYLQNSKLDITGFCFVCRQVKYPDSADIATPADLASAYYHNLPHVIGSVKLLDEAEFSVVLDKIRTSRSSLPPWEKSKAMMPINDEITNLIDDFLVRGFLYKGATTELCAQSGIGKSRFALALGRYVVAGDRPFLKERFWTRGADPSVPKKVIYWGFDDVTQKNIENWNWVYKEGLPEEFKDNFFIEFAPPVIRKQKEPNMNVYKREIMKYTYLGKQGQLPDLLIIDSLSDIAGIGKIFEALSFLSELKKQGFPNLSILAIHHETDIGNIRGASSARMKPRVIMTMKATDKDSKDLGFLPMPEEGDEWEMAYARGTNIPIADVERLPFCITRDENLSYIAVDPICKRQEYGKLLKYYYNNKHEPKLKNEQVAFLLGCGIDSVEKTFNAKTPEIKKITIAINEKIKAKAGDGDKTEEMPSEKPSKKARKKSSGKSRKRRVEDTEIDESEKKDASEKSDNHES